MESIIVEHFEQLVLPSEKRCFEFFRQIREMGVPIAVDESLFSIEDVKWVLNEEVVDVGVIKLAKFGGPLAALEIVRAFEAAGKVCVIGSSYESFIGKAMSIEMATFLENCDRGHELAIELPRQILPNGAIIY